MKYIKNLSDRDFREFIGSFDVVLSDCDGEFFCNKFLFLCLGFFLLKGGGKIRERGGLGFEDAAGVEVFEDWSFHFWNNYDKVILWFFYNN